MSFDDRADYCRRHLEERTDRQRLWQSSVGRVVMTRITDKALLIAVVSPLFDRPLAWNDSSIDIIVVS